jgi:DNA repair protein RadA/Sms
MAVAAGRPPRTRFVCASCGAHSPRWEGRCPECEEWNSLSEELLPRAHKKELAAAVGDVMLLADAPADGRRLPTGFAEVDRVLGGGIVPGSVILLGGDPGVGKSTLALQIADRAARAGAAALYCSGEESGAQVGLRARRTGCSAAGIELLVETDLDTVLATIEARRPPLAIVDSVQTVYDAGVAGSAGSPAQVRAAVARVVAAAKGCGVAVLLVGHVTKDGAIAGPRTLEHLVDVVLYLEGDRLGDQRILRGVKNRFGSTGEVGLLAMESGGIRELDAPSRAFMDGATAGIAGNALTVTCEGVRPLAIEVQALTVGTQSPLPRRTVSGFDVNRLHLLLAVLEKRADIRLGQSDVFVNAVGGVRLDDPAADLAVALAIAGSKLNRTLPPSCAVVGEVGLGGEVRRVARLDARLAEAAALGLETVIVPANHRGHIPAGLQCRMVTTIRDAIRLLA